MSVGKQEIKILHTMMKPGDEFVRYQTFPDSGTVGEVVVLREEPALPTETDSLGYATVTTPKGDVFENVLVHLMDLGGGIQIWSSSSLDGTGCWLEPYWISNFRPLVARPRIERDDLFEAVASGLNRGGPKDVDEINSVIDTVLELMNGEN